MSLRGAPCPGSAAPEAEPLGAPTGASTREPAAEARQEQAPFAGVTQQLGANRPFLLRDDRVWFIERGQVDIFSVLMEDGAPTGRRTHYVRVSTGEILLPMGPGATAMGRRFLAVPTNGTKLVETSRDAFRAWLGEARGDGRGRALCEAWIVSLCQGFARDARAKPAADLPRGRRLHIQEATTIATTVASPSGMTWVRADAGRALLLGAEALILPEGVFVPIAAPAFIEAQPAARVELSETSGLPGLGAFWRGLEALGLLAWRYSLTRATAEERASTERAQRRSEAARATLGGACTSLAAALYPRGHAVPALVRISEGAEHDLLGCCRLVGNALGVTIKPPPRADKTRAARDPLASILRGSKVRARRVALRGEWWRRDYGPLVAQTAADARPIALLRSKRGYAAYDPSASAELSPRPVDAESAASLAPFAHTLYRPLPAMPIGVRTLLGFGARGCARDVVLVLLLGLAVTLLGMFPAFATSLLFNDVIPGAHRPQLVQMTLLLVAGALASTGFNVSRAFALQRIQQRMGTGVQAGVWDRLMRLPLSFFRNYTAGDLAVRAMAIDGIQQILSGTTLMAIMSGLFSLANLAMMFHYSTPMAWRALLVLAIAIVPTVISGLLQVGPQRASIAMQGKTSGLVLQLLTSVSKLRVAGAEIRAFAQWVERFAAQRRLQIKIRRIGAVLSSFMSAFPMFAYVTIFWAALPGLEARGSVRTGDVLAFTAAFGSCLGALLHTCNALIGALAAIPLYEQAKPILRAQPEVHEGRSDPGVLSGDIELQHVVFRYEADGPPALRDVNVRVAPGEFVAFVGPSGSGKSTLLKLLLGFETLESGSIHYDGQELSGLDVQEVRRQMGVVLQNGRLLAGDILSNIVGSGGATIDEAWEAAELAGIADDIRAMPMNLHTVIPEGAGTLSGGQRQRLMIARAIVNRPRILLLDEATSALDNRTQAIVSASLERLKATRIVVAHRLTTIARADRIYVVDRGRIVQSGTFSDLLNQPGTFADLARRQLV